MEEIILIVCLITFGCLGYLDVGRVAKFLEANYEKDDNTNHKHKIKVLNNDLTEREILREIEEFKKENSKVKIILCEED